MSAAHMPVCTRKMEKDQINALPMWSYTGKVHLLENENQAQAAAQKISQQTIVGFDTETRPAFRKGQKFEPALLQLATDQAVYLFQLKKTGLPAGLLAVLEDRSIVKAGVATRDDIRELQMIQEFQPGGFVDLSEISHRNNLHNHGLRPLSAALLGIRISKKARQSNWANNNLSQAQICYASTDAWLSRELYLKMQNMGLDCN